MLHLLIEWGSDLKSGLKLNRSTLNESLISKLGLKTFSLSKPIVHYYFNFLLSGFKNKNTMAYQRSDEKQRYRIQNKQMTNYIQERR